MIWCAHLDRGEPFTRLKSVFSAIEHEQTRYHILLIGVEACPRRNEYEFVNRSPIWLTGQALTEMVEQEDFQWIWGAFLAFPRSVDRELALAETKKRYAPQIVDTDCWQIRTHFAQTRADFMILAGDSSYMELLSKEPTRIGRFCSHKPLAERFELDGTLEES